MCSQVFARDIGTTAPYEVVRVSEVSVRLPIFPAFEFSARELRPDVSDQHSGQTTDRRARCSDQAGRLFDR
jgi:hypothetical protein